MRVLVVEDDVALREQLTVKLREAGFVVDAAMDGEEGLYFGREYPIDAAVIDLGLPKMPGLEVIRILRSEGYDIPILILTARSRWQEKVEGLEAGADDYLAKPFQFEELLARVRALIRRAAGQADPVLRVGPIALDSRSQQVSVEGQSVELTAYEYRLLYYLMMNLGKVISKGELTEHLYEDDDDRDSNVLEVFVGRLRKKIDPSNTLKPIETLRGRGYRFREPE